MIVSRRDFLKIGGVALTGLVIGFRLEPGRADASGGGDFTPNAFLAVDQGGGVTVLVPRSESGQGVLTSLAMIVADALGCDWEQVKCRMAPVAGEYSHPRFPGEMVTGVSSSVSSEWDRLSLAGRVARGMLVAAAARRWGVEPRLCRVERGEVTGPDGRRLPFGPLVDEARGMTPAEPELPERGGIVGSPLPRVDLPSMTSSDRFAIDHRQPGMLTALVVRPPVFGAVRKNLDSDMTREIAGVREIVEMESGVAVVADDFWTARRGAEVLRPVWDWKDGLSRFSGNQLKRYRSLAGKPGSLVLARGRGGSIPTRGGILLEYDLPHLAHAPMEPPCCVVIPKGERWLFRVATDAPARDRRVAASILGVDQERVELEVIPAGGSFGRRLFLRGSPVAEAAAVARRLKRPVKLLWTREDDIRSGEYRPLMLHRIRVSLDGKGNPLGWLHRIVGQSVMTGTFLETHFVRDGIDATSVEGVVDTPYPIPHFRVELHTTEGIAPAGWWRGGGHTHSCFAMESAIDELAHRTGKDPLSYRRRLLSKEPRLVRLLDAVERMSGWKKKPHPGVGRGVAIHQAFGSCIALVAEVRFDPMGMIQVRRIWSAVDCGRTVNPDILRLEIESGIVFGLSATLFGEITIREGSVDQRNFDGYQPLRMLNTPPIEIELMESDLPPGGASSLGVLPVAPAVANALYASVRSRVRSLPITAQKVIDAHGK